MPLIVEHSSLTKILPNDIFEKTNTYEEIFQLHAKLLKALSNPRRLEILSLLRDKELPVNRIRDMLYLPQGNLSQHLMVLRQAGVVKTRKVGKQIYYKIAHKNFVMACDLMRSVLLERYAGDVLFEYLGNDINDLVPITHDPVCGMRLSPKTTIITEDFEGTKYYFCASGCLKKFKENPNRYVKEPVKLKVEA